MPAGRKIRVSVEWRYIGCSGASTGVDLIVDELCCNRKCKCKVSSERVSSKQLAIARDIDDFTSTIPPLKSYNCATLNELDNCQKECFMQLGKYLDSDIANPAKTAPINLNLFENNQKRANRVIIKNLISNLI